MCVEAIINELPEELMGENDFIHDIKQDEESECQKRFEKVPCKRKSKYKKKNIHEECPKTKFFREEIPPSPACEDNPCTEEDSTEDAEYRDINYQNEFENSIRQILNNHETNNEFCKGIIY